MASTSPGRAEREVSNQRRALLLETASRAQQQREKYPLPQDGDTLRAEAINYLQELAGFYTVDPTLSGDSARSRPVDLAAELARQLVPVVRHRYQDPAVTRRTTEETWAVVQDIADRLRMAMTAARAAVRPDWEQPEVCREISRARAVQVCGRLEELAGWAAEALAPALALPYPAPEAEELAAAVEHLRELIKAASSG